MTFDYTFLKAFSADIGSCSVINIKLRKTCHAICERPLWHQCRSSPKYLVNVCQICSLHAVFLKLFCTAGARQSNGTKPAQTSGAQTQVWCSLSCLFLDAKTSAAWNAIVVVVVVGWSRWAQVIHHRPPRLKVERILRNRPTSDRTVADP